MVMVKYLSIMIQAETGVALPGKQISLADIPNINNVLQNDTYGTSKFFSRRLHLPLSQKVTLILSLNNRYLDFQNSQFSKGLKYSASITLFIIAVFGAIFSILLNRFFVDYTSRGEYINELKGLNSRIQNLLQKNKVYMEMASDGIHILDKEGNVVAFSHSFANMLGYTEEEASKLNVRDWEADIPPEQITDMMQSFYGEPKKLETKHRCKDGSIIDIEINARWITTADGDYFYASSRDITERKQMENELQELATTDSLTHLSTRRAFLNELSNEIERCQRQPNYSVSVILLDLDHFKTVNDTYGHGTGDKVLQNIAHILKDEIRQVDAAGRFGGEEFSLILTDTDEKMALHVTNRIRSRIQETRVTYEGCTIYCTASIGITEIKESDSDIKTILERADKALYQAKEKGRNRVEIYKESQQ